MFSTTKQAFASVVRWSFAAAAMGAIGCGQASPEASGSPEPDPESIASALAFPAVVSAGETHACANSRGLIKCWGNNASGKLGLGNTANRGDTAGEMDDNLPWVDLGQTTTHISVSKVVAGGSHTCALFADGNLKCWGANSFGQLGIGSTSARGDNAGEMGTALPHVNLGTGRRARAVALGLNHTCAILDDSSVKCWGSNADGQLGLGDTNSRGTSASQMGDNLPTVNLGSQYYASEIYAGGNHTCALLGTVRDAGPNPPKVMACWGRNASGQLGINSTSNRGDGPNEMGSNLALVVTGGAEPFRVAAGADHTCAVFTNGNQVKCWGLNSSGQLGLGNTTNRGGSANDMQSLPFLNLGFTVRVSEMSARRNHTCVRYVAGDGGNASVGVKCWGSNGSGRLGRGDTSNRGDNPNEMGDSLTSIDFGFPVSTGFFDTTLGAGGDFSCASGQLGVKCWGNGGNGVIGQGNTTDRGDGAGEMGTNLAWVPLGTPSDGGI